MVITTIENAVVGKFDFELKLIDEYCPITTSGNLCKCSVDFISKKRQKSNVVFLSYGFTSFSKIKIDKTPAKIIQDYSLYFNDKKPFVELPILHN